MTPEALPGPARTLRRPAGYAMPQIAQATVAASGARRNEDALLVRRDAPVVLAVADGAGRAEGAARRALDLLQRLIAESVAAGPKALHVAPAWRGQAPAAGDSHAAAGGAVLRRPALFGKSVSRGRLEKECDRVNPKPHRQPHHIAAAGGMRPTFACPSRNRDGLR